MNFPSSHPKRDTNSSATLITNDSCYNPIDLTIRNDNGIPRDIDNSIHSHTRPSSSGSCSASESSFNSSLGLGDSHNDNLHSSATETDFDSDVHSDELEKSYENLEQLRRSVRQNLQLRPLRVSSLQSNGVDTVTLTPQSATHLDSAVSDDTFYDFGQSPTSSINTRSTSAFSDYDNDTDVYYTPTTEIGSAPSSARWVGNGSTSSNGLTFTNPFSSKRSESPVTGARIPSPITNASSHALPNNRPAGLDPNSLLLHLPNPIGIGTRPLLIDTRSLQSFLRCRIKGSVNVAIPSLIMRRFHNRLRKPSKPINTSIGGAISVGFGSLDAVRMYVTTENGRRAWDALMGSGGSGGRINSGWNGDVVVYDEDMDERDVWQDRDRFDSTPPIQNQNQSQSLAWSLIPLLLPLIPGKVYHLKGGFAAFHAFGRKDADINSWIVSGEEEFQIGGSSLNGDNLGPLATGRNDSSQTLVEDNSENRFTSTPPFTSTSVYAMSGTPAASSTLPANAFKTSSNFNSSPYQNAFSGSAHGSGQIQTHTPSPRKGGLFHLDVQNSSRSRFIPDSEQTISSASSSSTSTPSSSSSFAPISQSQSQQMSSSPPPQSQLRSYSLSPPSAYKYPSTMTSSPPPLTLQVHSDTPSPSPSAILFPHRDNNRPRKASVPNLRRLDTSSMERLGGNSNLPRLSLKTSIGVPHRATTLATQPFSHLDGEGNNGSILERLGPLSPMRTKTDFPSLHPPPPNLNADGSSFSRKFLSPNIHLNGTSDCSSSMPLSPITPTTFSQHHNNNHPHHPPTPRADSITFTFQNNNNYSNSSSPSPSPSPFQDPPTTDTDNPMPVFSISTILPNFLFLGPELSTPEHVDELLGLGVKRILNIAIECDDDLGLNLKDRFEKYEKIPMRDTVEEENVEKSVRMACDMLDDARLHSAPTYVHCKAGKSRSVTAVIAYLIHANHWTLSQAYSFVVERRKGISPNIGFVSELMNYEEQELGTKSMGVGLGAVPGSSSGLSNFGCGDDSGKGLGMKVGSGKTGRRGHHSRESLPPTFQPQPIMTEILQSISTYGDSSGGLGNPAPSPDLIADSSHEMEVKDASGRYRHLRRAPVDETTLQPSRRMSKAGLESTFSIGSSSSSTDD